MSESRRDGARRVARAKPNRAKRSIASDEPEVQTSRKSLLADGGKPLIFEIGGVYGGVMGQQGQDTRRASPIEAARPAINDDLDSALSRGSRHRLAPRLSACGITACDARQFDLTSEAARERPFPAAVS